MKYLALLALAVAASASAQTLARVQSVGQSQQPPKVVAQCIAKKWADKSQQPVISQSVLANDQAFDVYMPGQQAPAGAAAIVRVSGSGTGSSVGFRASGAAGSDATSDISACL